jgi:hypothetical protein
VGSQGDAAPCLEPLGEPVCDARDIFGQFLGPRLPAGGDRALPHGNELLEPAHGDTLGHDSHREPLLRFRVVDRQQSACVSRREHSGRDPSLDRRREPEQPDRVGYLRA